MSKNEELREKLFYEPKHGCKIMDEAEVKAADDFLSGTHFHILRFLPVLRAGVSDASVYTKRPPWRRRSLCCGRTSQFDETEVTVSLPSAFCPTL